MRGRLTGKPFIRVLPKGIPKVVIIHLKWCINVRLKIYDHHGDVWQEDHTVKMTEGGGRVHPQSSTNQDFIKCKSTQ